MEWTLGFALAEIDFRPHREKLPTSSSSSSSFGSATDSPWKYYVHTVLREMLAPVKLVLHLLHATLGVLQQFIAAFIRGDSHTLPARATMK